MAKTIWIVDGAYLYKSPLGHFDYLKLKAELEKLNDGPLFESYYLNSTMELQTDAQSQFHNWLKKAPPIGPKLRVQLYKLKDVYVQCPGCGKSFERQIQKGVDVGIATLILKLATQNKCDRLILSAGDGDFEDAIDYAKSELHKEVWICGFKNNISSDLQCYADRVIWMDDLWNSILKQD
ncbi:MAG: NYN domain-containing protein [Planctomycetes bacterium]|nr:NYN domain-containing protein [Planctomycetota bacterium]